MTAADKRVNIGLYTSIAYQALENMRNKFKEDSDTYKKYTAIMDSVLDEVFCSDDVINDMKEWKKNE